MITEIQTPEENPEGLHLRYYVERTDGSSQPGGKHENCSYFVLDLEHDPYAVPALHAYAKACNKDLPNLAADLYEFVSMKNGGKKPTSCEVTWYSCDSEYKPTCEEFILVAGTMDGPHDWRVRMGYYNLDVKKFLPVRGSWEAQFWAYMPELDISAINMPE